MKKITILALCLAILVFFTSCNKEHGSTLKIKANVFKGNNYNNDCDNVRAIIDGDYEVARGDYKNRGFELTLPDDVPSSALYPVAGEMEFLEKLTISNKDANVTSVEFEGYKVNTFFDELEEANMAMSIVGASISMDMVYSVYVYSDSKTTIKGKLTATDLHLDDASGNVNVDITLYKGWSKYYYNVHTVMNVNLLTGNITATISGNISNKKPKDDNLQWKFSEDMGEGLGFKAPLNLQHIDKKISKALFR
jgi:hypothetical protein